jgi:hypothetical protein
MGEELKRGDLVEIEALEDVFFLIVPGRLSDSCGKVGKIPLWSRMDTRHGSFDTQRMLRVGIGEVVVGLVVRKVIRVRPEEREPVEVLYVLIGEDIIILDPGSPGHGGHYHLEAGYVTRKAVDPDVV